MNRNKRSCSVAALICLAVFSSPHFVFAQPGGERGFRGGGFGGPGGGFGGGGILGLLSREEVQQELQLVDEQQEKVDGIATEIRDQMRAEMQEMFSRMRDLSDEERRERFDEIRSRMEKVNADVEKRLKKVLLPHQFDRLKQIDLQVRLQQRGAGALTSGELAETLGLSDEQREKLERRAAEVQQELEQQISQLRIDARNKMLDVLTPEQRAKLESLLGDDLTLTDQGAGFGGRGGRGGFFGGNRNGNDGEGRRGGNRGGDRD
jgi:Spy/CpxP family protein refolding chaperone